MENRTKVIAICQAEIPSALVGVNKPLNELKKGGLLEFEFIETAQVTKQDIAECDVLICIRGTESYELEIVRECKRFGRYVIYFLDDDLLNVPETANSYGYFNNVVIRQNIEEIMTLSDCLWTTNQNIAFKYKHLFDKTAILDAPALLLEEDGCKENDKTEKNKLRIGFSGGIDHQHFLETLLEEPINVILEAYKDKVEFEFMGAHPTFIDKWGIQYIPYEKNHDRYKEVMKQRQWDIGLAPLMDSPFHRCKYINKFLEYGTIGAAGVYSNVQPYTFAIENGVNGLLTDNTPEGWTEAIRTLIVNTELRDCIATNAKVQLQEHFTVESIAEQLREQIDAITLYKAPLCDKNEIRLSIVPKSYFFNKIIGLLKREGFKVPIYVIKRILLYIRTRY